MPTGEAASERRVPLHEMVGVAFPQGKVARVAFLVGDFHPRACDQIFTYISRKSAIVGEAGDRVVDGATGLVRVS